MGQAFQLTLSGPALRWLMSLDYSQTRTWEDMVKAFKNQYSYNTEMELTRRDLETTRQEVREGFTPFLIRFRKKAAQMWDRPSDKEQVRMFF